MEQEAVSGDFGALTARGCVYWVTGLSGSGKTTLSQALVERLGSLGRSVVQLDGDRMRAILGGRFGYTQSDRHLLAQTYGRLCKELGEQGHDVVCATVSMFHDVRAWNRDNIRHYVEIYLRMAIDQLVERHPKGLYSRGLAGHIRHVPGIDIVLEEPEAPDLILDAALPPAAVVADLFSYLDTIKKAA